MSPLPNVPGRLLLPDLAAADLALELERLARPSPGAPLVQFKAWSTACSARAAQVISVQAQFAPLLCRFCLGFATCAGRPCGMCDATGLSARGRQAVRFHHNGE